MLARTHERAQQHRFSMLHYYVFLLFEYSTGFSCTCISECDRELFFFMVTYYSMRRPGNLVGDAICLFPGWGVYGGERRENNTVQYSSSQVPHCRVWLQIDIQEYLFLRFCVWSSWFDLVERWVVVYYTQWVRWTFSHKFWAASCKRQMSSWMVLCYATAVAATLVVFRCCGVLPLMLVGGQCPQ